jgi:hypothetical protein
MKPVGATDGLNAASEALEILERYEQGMLAFDADALAELNAPDPRTDHLTRSTAIHEQLVERSLSDDR